MLTGCPIRKSALLGIFAPQRGLSQLVTSFFASESQGILHVPFSPFLFSLRKVAFDNLYAASPHCVKTYLARHGATRTPRVQLSSFLFDDFAICYLLVIICGLIIVALACGAWL